jgi:hypothetical protein
MVVIVIVVVAAMVVVVVAMLVFVVVIAAWPKGSRFARGRNNTGYRHGKRIYGLEGR